MSRECQEKLSVDLLLSIELSLKVQLVDQLVVPFKHF